MLDLAKLKFENKRLIGDIRALKKIFREPHQPRLKWEHHYQLINLKKRATQIYSLLASLRGRIHLNQKFKTLEEQNKFLEVFSQEFLLDTRAA